MGQPQNREQGPDGGHMPEVGEDCLRSLLAFQPTEFMRLGPKRETFAFDLPGGTPVVVKRYGSVRAGEGLRQLALGKRPRHPGMQEHQNLQDLRAAGLSVPAPLGSISEGSASLVVLEHLGGLVSLRDHLALHPEDVARLFPEVLQLVVRFHRAGWYHRDLYLDHLVLAGDEGRLYLIDLERARRDPIPLRRWFVKDLAALYHSLPEAVPRSWALRFLSRWLDARGVSERKSRRDWWRAIFRKEASMAKHTPRGGTSYPQDL